MSIRACILILLAALPVAANADESTTSTERASRPGSVPSIELDELIARVAKRTGKQFVIDPRVRAVVPMIGFDAGGVGLERLLAILRVHNFVAVDEGDFYTVQPDAVGRQLAGPLYSDLKFKALDDEIVTVLMDVKNACAAQLVPVLRPLMPQAAHMAADIQTNTLILNDRAANLRRVGAMVERLDRAAPAGRKCEGMPPPPPRPGS